MALAATYDFEGGSLDATITTGGGVTVTGSPTYKTGIHGSLAARLIQGQYLDFAAPASTHGGSMYLTVNSVIASSASRAVRVQNGTGGWVSVVRFHYLGSVDITTGTSTTGTAGTWTAGDTYRVDWTVNHATTTLTWRLFKNANIEGDTYDYQVVVNYAAVDSGAAATVIGCGAGGSPTGTSIDFDTIRLYDSAEWAGPFDPPTAASGSLRLPSVPTVPSIPSL